jgi:hypothetical protein
MPRNGGGVRNALLPIMHPSMAIVHRHCVVLDEIVLMPEEWTLQIDAKGASSHAAGFVSTHRTRGYCGAVRARAGQFDLLDRILWRCPRVSNSFATTA